MSEVDHAQEKKAASTTGPFAKAAAARPDLVITVTRS